jgi:Circularly permutated YpsA SLOG family
MITRIVSGGQTGVDRAALDVSLALGIPCGGWSSRGRNAEDCNVKHAAASAGHPPHSWCFCVAGCNVKHAAASAGQPPELWVCLCRGVQCKASRRVSRPAAALPADPVADDDPVAARGQDGFGLPHENIGNHTPRMLLHEGRVPGGQPTGSGCRKWRSSSAGEHGERRSHQPGTNRESA